MSEGDVGTAVRIAALARMERECREQAERTTDPERRSDLLDDVFAAQARRLELEQAA